MKHSRSIDGLRAVAVLAVVLFHVGFGLPGGFVGVDVFFALSGYLITRVLLAANWGSVGALKGFYFKRIRRLAPASIAMVIFVLLIAHKVYTPRALADLTESAIAQSLFLPNIYFWRESGYFTPAAEAVPLLHTWSLGVEEQYYLLYPLLIWSMLRFGVPLKRALSILTILAFALSHFMAIRHPSAAFYLPFARAYELLAGGVLSLQHQHRKGEGVKPRRLSNWLAFVGLLLILWASMRFNGNTPFPGAASLVPVLGTLLVLEGVVASERCPTARVLGSGPLVFIGKLSYSIYLWHWPVIVFAKYLAWGQGVTGRAIQIGLTLVCAMVSFYLVEQPIRQRRMLPGLRSSLCAFGVVQIAILGYCIGTIADDGRPGRFANWTDEISRDEVWTGSDYEYGVGVIQPEGRIGVRIGCRTDSLTRFAIWGDSHARVLARAFDLAGERLGIGGICYAKSSRPPGIGVWHPQHGDQISQYRRREAILNEIVSLRPSLVFLVARWSSYAVGPNQIDLQDMAGQGRRSIGFWSDANPAQSQVQGGAVVAEGLSRVIDRLRAEGIDVLLVEQVPETGIASPSNMVARECIGLGGERLPRDIPSTGWNVRGEQIDDWLSLHGVGAVGRLKLLGGHRVDGPILLRSDAGNSLYWDDDHISWTGAALCANGVASVLESVRYVK